MSKTASLTIESSNGKYTVGVEGKRSRLPIEKIIYHPDGSAEPKTMFVPMEQIKVTLLHKSGDIVEYKKTAMGRKVSWSRIYNGCGGLKTISKLATGPEILEKLSKGEPMSEEKLVATIARCTDLPMSTVKALFTWEALEEHEAKQEATA